MVLMALASQMGSLPAVDGSQAGSTSTSGSVCGRRPAADCRRRSRDRRQPAGLAWLLAMQNRDGGWGGVRPRHRQRVPCHVPFADHNAMLDPSSPDITGRVLEAARAARLPRGRSGGRPGLAYLRADAGSRRLLVRPLGRELHLRHLAGARRAEGGRRPDGRPGRGARRPTGCEPCQQPCGGWGEIVPQLRRPDLRGQGTPTASQTAWAVLGLIAAGEANRRSRRRGIAVPASARSARRHLGRDRIHRHRLPAGVLPEVSLTIRSTSR